LTTRLWLTPAQAETIARQALDARPDEACGLIAGIGEQAQQIIPILNKADDPQHHFQFDEIAFTNAMFEIERAGLSLIGIYHSHPNTDPIPSQTDIRQSNYPHTAYVIVGLKQGEPRLAAWEIRHAMVNPVDLHISTQPPPPQESPLSRAQKTAIIVAAVVAVVFMLILSLSLLPPAPIIVSPLP
jgi:[CysO sulfur-carrier protein]-S-L-cysteine hydrolase